MPRGREGSLVPDPAAALYWKRLSRAVRFPAHPGNVCNLPLGSRGCRRPGSLRLHPPRSPRPLPLSPEPALRVGLLGFLPPSFSPAMPLPEGGACTYPGCGAGGRAGGGGPGLGLAELRPGVVSVGPGPLYRLRGGRPRPGALHSCRPGAGRRAAPSSQAGSGALGPPPLRLPAPLCCRLSLSLLHFTGRTWRTAVGGASPPDPGPPGAAAAGGAGAWGAPRGNASRPCCFPPGPRSAAAAPGRPPPPRLWRPRRRRREAAGLGFQGERPPPQQPLRRPPRLRLRHRPQPPLGRPCSGWARASTRRCRSRPPSAPTCAGSGLCLGRAAGEAAAER